MDQLYRHVICDQTRKINYFLDDDGKAEKYEEKKVEIVTRPSFCTTESERVYITAMDCESWLGRFHGLQAAGAGGL